MPWLEAVRAAAERRDKLMTLRMLTVTHAKDPAALQKSLLGELAPQAVERPFARMLARARQGT